ncbi:MAG: isoaspartyl peptidase/L-asparaginase [Woeseiaceae bacterium]|nr:isoaspartyl peptidase/L-asparaginase [Woeseiaceae bacterium]
MEHGIERQGADPVGKLRHAVVGSCKCRCQQQVQENRTDPHRVAPPVGFSIYDDPTDRSRRAEFRRGPERGEPTIDKHHALAIHGGAGAIAGRDYAATEQHLAGLAEAARQRLAGGAHALDVVEDVVAEMETSGLYVAGRGSAPNVAGYVELDASIMAGATRAAGAVAAVSGIACPVRVARGVMERTPHVLLAGAGALAFARAEGFELVEDARAWYRLPVGVRADEARGRHGTVGAVARDRRGALAAATSTGGTFGKLEGRVGDTPLVGAGTWADDDVAVSCTGVGEQIIRAGGALAVAYRLRAGASLAMAVDEMLAEVRRLGGDGGVIAVRRDGEVVMRYNSGGMKRAAVSDREPLVSKTFG